MANGEQELGTDFKLFCWDARKFMISNGSIYCSALIFSPKNSLVCRASSEERPSWLLRYHSPCERWDQCVLEAASFAENHSSMPIAFSPDSNRIAFFSGSCVEIWSVKCGIPIDSFELLSIGENLLFSPNGKHIALIVDAASIWLYDTVAESLDYVLETPGYEIDRFLFSPNGLFIVSISDDQVNVWTAAEAELYWTLTARDLHWSLAERAENPGPGPLKAIHFDVNWLEVSSDSSLIATVSSDHVFKLWNIEKKSLHFRIPLEGGDCSRTLGFSANQNLIIVQRMKVTSWDYKSNKMHTTTLSIRDPGHSQILASDLSHWLSPDGSILATSTDGHDLFLFNTTTGECFNTKTTHESSFDSLCFSSDSIRIALYSDIYGQEVILHDIMSVDRIDTIPVDHLDSGAVLFSPDGSMLAYAGNYTMIWDVSTMSRKSVREKGSRISHILLSVDGTKALYARHKLDKPTELCMLDVLHDLSTTIEPNLFVENLSISPDKNYVLAQGADNSNARRTYLYNVHEKNHLNINLVGATAFSHSSQLLAIAGLDFKIRILDVRSGDCMTTLGSHSCAIIAIEFSPSDARLASTDATRNTMVWDYRSNSLEAVFPHQSWGRSESRAEIAFSSDESMLAYYSGEEVYLCGLETKTRLETFHAFFKGSRERTLSFSDEGRYLRTSSAAIDLWPFASPCLDMGYPLDFTDGAKWIRWHGRKILRPPDDWSFTKCDSWGNRLAMANDKGEVAFIEFDPEELRKALGI
ncbi:hypothetical protein D6D22_06640 [Aureobasidium pullulans]|uniref:Uncharacterized protein n=1 Tax=Aureobasidium pullulans TaxID=5580 RepID=A0A4S8XMJ5_AURPU|nr:hypothetical protein D6D22_06640 [Aureobasidium pullulans]